LTLTNDVEPWGRPLLFGVSFIRKHHSRPAALGKYFFAFF
jgi:hypothetical protein